MLLVLTVLLLVLHCVASRTYCFFIRAVLMCLCDCCFLSFVYVLVVRTYCGVIRNVPLFTSTYRN